MMGTGVTSARFDRPGGSPSMAEYALHARNVRTAYASTVGYLQRTGSCRQTTSGRSGGPTFVGVLPLPRSGALSVCMLFDDSVAGVTSQSGYEVVRQGSIVLVVGYANPGTLDVAALQHTTAMAVQKLGG